VVAAGEEEKEEEEAEVAAAVVVEDGCGPLSRRGYKRSICRGRLVPWRYQ
jgi:hypothetical protein